MEKDECDIKFFLPIDSFDPDHIVHWNKNRDVNDYPIMIQSNP